MKTVYPVILVLLISVGFNGYAQKKFTFGKVARKDLELTHYKNDSSAEAYVIFDRGEFNNQTFKFYRHFRIKILKPSGTGWANLPFVLPSATRIKGYVFNLEGNKVVREKLTNKTIEKEEVFRGRHIYKVFMPNVKVGSVIDVSLWFSGLPYEWRFQETIPVQYSELKIDRSPYLRFNTNYFGFEPIQVVDEGSHWIARDMPAFVEEPYANHYSNFITKLELDIRSYGRGASFVDIASEWEDVNKILYEADYVYGILNNTGFLNRFVKDIEELDLNDKQKIDTAYNYVKSQIKWNGVESLVASQTFRANFIKNHVGNAAEINLILVALLQKLGFTAHPVALSTRSSGLLSPAMPSVNKLNYIICVVEQNDKDILLDATAENLKVGMIPERCINGKGRLIAKDFSRWVDLTPSAIDKRQINLDLFIEGGEIFSKCKSIYSDYGYSAFKDSHDEGEEQNIFQIEQRIPGAVVDAYSVSFDKSKMIATEEFSMEVSNLADDFGQNLMISPLKLLDLDHMELPKIERKYPVDFVVPKIRFISIQIPKSDHLTLTSIPEPASIALPNREAVFSYSVFENDESVKIQIGISIFKSLFTEDKYEALRSFYTLVVEHCSRPLEFTKKT